jgi:RNA polymerase sigma-70 factor (ECF subfamily)
MSIEELEPDRGHSDPGGEDARLQFESFYRADMRALVRFVFTLGGAVDRESAADAAQEAMARAWKLWNTIEHPRAWVRTVAGRIWMSEHLKHRDIPDESIGDRPGSLLLRPRGGDHSDLIVTESALRIGLAKLTITQRQVMAWAVDEYEPKEIAEILGMNAATVRSHLSQARTILNPFLRNEWE